MGNRMGVGYSQSDIGGGEQNTEGGVVDISSPLIEDIPDVTEETSPETLDDIVNMIITKYENAINSNNLLNGNTASMDDLKRRNQQLQKTLGKIIQILKEKQNSSKNMVKHNEALQHQVDSLKDVINITRDLLNIRNTEVEHLHEDLQSLQDKIANERSRQVIITEKMETASRLNDTLKAEYQKQMDLFSKLRGKYDERVDAMTRENELLQKQLDNARNLANQSANTIIENVKSNIATNSVTSALEEKIEKLKGTIKSATENSSDTTDPKTIINDSLQTVQAVSSDVVQKINDKINHVNVILKTVGNALSEVGFEADQPQPSGANSEDSKVAEEDVTCLSEEEILTNNNNNNDIVDSD